MSRSTPRTPLHQRRLAIAAVVAAALASVAALGLPFAAQAIQAPAEILRAQSKPIPRAVSVYLTERGQKYFNDNLLNLLARHGYEISDGGFESWSYQADDPILLDGLPVHMRGFSGTFKEVRKIIKRWLMNSEVGDPLIQAELTNIAYSAQFAHFGVRVDAAETARLMNDRGLVIVFEAEIPQVRLDVESAQALDRNNAFLQPLGASHPWTLLLPKSAPLKVTVPLCLRLGDGGGLNFEILDIRTNLADLDVDLGYDRPLQLPKVTLKVNGYPFTLNQARLEQELLKQKAPLLKALQAFLGDYLSTYSPAALNTMVARKYSNLILSDLNEMDPPGADRPTGPADRYRWGVSPEEIHLTRDYLMVGMSGFIEDPRAKNPAAEVSRRLVTQPPVLNVIDPSTYDAALAINEDLVNRVLGMGYLRGYFPKVDVSGSAPLKVLQAPEFHFTGASASDRGKLHVKVMHRVQGLDEQIAMRGEVTFEMDVNARLVHSAQNKLSVVVDSVDTNSLNIDYSTVHKLFRGMVHHSLVKHLLSTNRDLAKKPNVIVDALPVPSQVGGIPIKIKDFRADPNGYLVLYTEYDLTR